MVKYDLYAMDYFYAHDVHMVDVVANAVRDVFGVDVFTNYDGRMAIVYGLDVQTLRTFVQMFGGAVHDVDYDYDYGYDEYNDPLQVNYGKVVLYFDVALYSLD